MDTYLFLDKDGDGRLSYTELRKHQYTLKEILNLDIDGDNYVSIEEWITFLKNVWEKISIDKVLRKIDEHGTKNKNIVEKVYFVNLVSDILANDKNKAELIYNAFSHENTIDIKDPRFEKKCSLINVYFKMDTKKECRLNLVQFEISLNDPAIKREFDTQKLNTF